METYICSKCSMETDIKLKKPRSNKCPKCFKDMKISARKANIKKEENFTCSLCNNVKDYTHRRGDTQQCKQCSNEHEKERYKKKKATLENIAKPNVTEKTCSKCNETKIITEFHYARTKGTYRAACKECTKSDRKNYYDNNKETANRYKAPYERMRSMTDYDFKLLKTLRCRLYHALLHQKTNKKTSTVELLGCTIKFAREYLEAKFKPDMSWENHGDWHIDHIKPCSSFDLKSEIEQKMCFHYTNLQPLWAKENLSKSNKEYHI